MTEFKPKIIKNNEDYELAMTRLSELMDLNPEQDVPDSDELELLALLIEHYESVHYPIEKPSPLDAVLFRMDQAGLTRKDMEKYLGSASKVSEVLSGKRKLSMAMIQKLHYGLGIALDILIQKPDDIEWSDKSSLLYLVSTQEAVYPFKSMNRQEVPLGLIPDVSSNTVSYSSADHELSLSF